MSHAYPIHDQIRMGINMAKVLDLFDYATGEAPNIVVNKKNQLKTNGKKKPTRRSRKQTKIAAAKGNVNDDYTADDIEVLEGLEPVRRRPGMYVGGTDAHALHHLLAEVLDNSMDEAIAGHATWIELALNAD